MNNRNAFYGLIFCLISLVFNSNSIQAQFLYEEEEPPDNYQLQIFLKQEDALEKVFAGCDTVESEYLVLTSEGHEYFKELLKRPFLAKTFPVYIGKKDGEVDRYAIITEEMGCFHPITWIMSTDSEGNILKTAVMIYRETRGHEITRKRFLHQFKGKSIDAPLSINKDVIRITGATVSVRAVCRGIKKVLTILNEFYIEENPSTQNLAHRFPEEEYEATTVSQSQLYTTARDIRGVQAVISAEAESEIGFFSVANKAFKEMERIEILFKQELKTLNRQAWKEPISCDREVFLLLKRCFHYSDITDGAFDITVHPLLKKLGIYKQREKEIPPGKMEPILKAVSYKNIQFDEKKSLVYFKHKRTRIEMESLIKAYAVDRALELIKESGLTSVYVHYGYVARMLKPPSDKKSWKVGVSHPLKEDSIIGKLQISEQGVAFVADYTRFPDIESQMYLHRVDPRTGIPVKNEIFSVTAMADTAEKALVLATAMFISGKDNTKELSEHFPHVKWMIMSKSQEGIDILVSRKIKEYFIAGEEKKLMFGKGSGCSFSP